MQGFYCVLHILLMMTVESVSLKRLALQITVPFFPSGSSEN